MRKHMFQRLTSSLLALLLVLSMAAAPVSAAAGGTAHTEAAQTQEEAAAKSFTVTPVGTVTPQSTQASFRIACTDPSLTSVNVFLLPVGKYGPDEENAVARKFGAAVGDVTLDIPSGSLKVGDKLAVKLTYWDGDDIYEYLSKESEYITVTDGQSSAGKTREEIISNTSAVLMQNGAARTESFRQTDTSVDVQIKLDDTVESCYMTVYAYIGTARFDPDNSRSSFVLWKGMVSDGLVTCPFNQDVALQVGYKIIACINTPAGKDAEGSTNYAYVNSQAIEVVDENGQGFQPYTYPDITIDEQTLEPGATSLHISMTGDQRIFDAAAAGKLDINYTIGMYPADDEFQIEDGTTIALVQLGETTTALEHYEVTFTEPLRAGWRVRAVAYWDNCPELFIARGNDYEFNQKDDSVLVSGTAAEKLPKAVVSAVTADAAGVGVTLSGEIPAGSVLILRSFDSTAESFSLSGGYWAGTQANAEAKAYTMAPAADAMEAGRKLVAFVVNSGKVIAQSEPVVIEAAKPAPAQGTVVLNESSYTVEAAQATVTVSGCEEFVGGRLFVTTGRPITDNDDSRAKLGQVSFTGAGTYTIPFNTAYTKLTEGNTIQAYLYKYDSDTDQTLYRYSASVAITAAGESGEKTPEEILRNTTATLMKDGAVRTENFKQSETSVDVKVTLDSSLDRCYMTVYAYSSNTTFDPDGSYNKRLWTGYVKDGETVTCTFNQELPLYYNVIACLNVPVGEDFYRPSNSQALEVVDEGGQGFRDYVYPDASIVETQLEPGATKLHIRLTGDERLFQAAREDQTSITVAVAQYPDGETFDFEGEKQISLASNLNFTQAVDSYEVTLAQPLKAGWRVRAVVYWRQNPSIFLTKGNDYEEMFHRPDDSVLVSGTPEEDLPAAAIQGAPEAEDTTVTVRVGGVLPEGTMLLLKRYEADTTSFTTQTGTFVASGSVEAAGEQVLTVSGLVSGEKLVAFLLHNGNLLAQSDAVTIGAQKPASLFTITCTSGLTAESTQASFQITCTDPDITSLGAFLCPVTSYGVDSDNWLARKLGQKPGNVTLDIPAGSLKDGDVVRLVLIYEKGEDMLFYFGTEADNLTVGAAQPVEQDSVVLKETSFDTGAAQATVTVTGCDAYKDGYLILTMGRAEDNDNGDSRTRLGSVRFTGAGTYTVTFAKSVTLVAGQTIQAHLYKYDFDKDATMYKYSQAVPISSGSQPAVEAKVSIATGSVTADRTDVWVQASYDPSLTGVLKLYVYDGAAFDAAQAEEIYSGSISSSESSQRASFGSGKLTAGKKLTAVLVLSDGSQAVSEAKTIQAAPEKEAPAVRFVTRKVTAGMTNVKASMTFDASASGADYTIYQFTGETLDTASAQVLSTGHLYRSNTKETVSVGRGKLVPGSKLQIVLTVDGTQVRSDVLTVEPSPDWGTPYAAFNVSAVKTDAKSVSVQIDYADEYVAMGDDFYCDVTIYQFPGSYSDQEFESRELWENLTLTHRVGQINSNYGDETRGASLTIPIRESAELKAGNRLIIKLRLPHTEWEGEEADYLSASIPVIGAEETVPDYKVVLYNLGEDTSRGARLRQILRDLHIPAETMTYEHLNETVGYLAGLDGYPAAERAYTGNDYDTEFMLLCNLPEALLDRFLEAMQTEGLRIDHKAVVTAYNREKQFHELMDDISQEHDVFQALLELDRLIQKAEALDEQRYQDAPNWDAFQKALADAKDVLGSEEPTLEELNDAIAALKKEYLTLTGTEEIRGKAVITLKKESDGTYTLTAGVQNGISGAAYRYVWSNGETGARMTGVPAGKLASLTVTVSAETLLGTLTAQLQVPHAPKAAAAATDTTVTVRWSAMEEADNRPAPQTVAAALYCGGKLVETKTVKASDLSVRFTGLKENTDYTVRLYAESPVGRSDVRSLRIATEKKGYDWKVRPVFPGISNPFRDVSEKDYFFDAVLWAVDEGITEGTGRNTFGPNGTCTRAQLVTFLYRAAGSPAVGSGTTYFADVSARAYYADAVRWAVETGIAKGISAAEFDPDGLCTREQTVTFLYRFARYTGAPVEEKPDKVLADFADGKSVSGYAAAAMQWALDAQIVQGAGGKLDPQAACSRAQIVTMLYRMLG